MNYSQNYIVNENENESKEKVCKMNPSWIPNINLNRQNSTLNNRQSQQETISPRHLPHSIIGLSPQSNTKK